MLLSLSIISNDFICIFANEKSQRWRRAWAFDMANGFQPPPFAALAGWSSFSRLSFSDSLLHEGLQTPDELFLRRWLSHVMLQIILEILSALTAASNSSWNLNRNGNARTTKVTQLATIVAGLFSPWNNLNSWSRPPLLKARLTKMAAKRAFGSGSSVDHGLSFVANLAEHTQMG